MKRHILNLLDATFISVPFALWQTAEDTYSKGICSMIFMAMLIGFIQDKIEEIRCAQITKR
jgi:hypothetical protein